MSHFLDLLIAALSGFLFNVFYKHLAMDSSHWMRSCLDSSSRILLCWWLWTSLYPVCQVCRKIIFCSFGMFEFLLRSKLFCFSSECGRFSYLGIHFDCALSLWASPVQPFRPIYRFLKPDRFSPIPRDQRNIHEVLCESSFSNLIAFWLCFLHK